MTRQRSLPVVAIIAVLALLITACGGTPAASPTASPAASSAAAATPSPTPKGPPDEVTIQLTFQVRGGLASLAAAQQKGYFTDENIKVTFAKGTSSLQVMSSVPDGQNVFVFGPDTAAAQAISQGVPLISVATFQTATPIGLIARPGVKLDSVKDVEGKRLALVTGDTFNRIWPSIAKKNNVDLTKVQATNYASAARITAFVNGDADIASVSLDNEGPLLQSQFKEKLATLNGEQMGFPLLGDGVTIRTSLLQAKPDLVKRFLRAVQRGYQATQADPNVGVESELALWASELPARDVLAAQIAVTVAADKASKVAGKPFGYVTADQWNTTVETLKAAGAITDRLPTEKYFTTDYLPEAPK